MSLDPYLNVRHLGAGVEIVVGWSDNEGREPSIRFVLNEVEAHDLMACVKSPAACARRAAIQAGADPADPDPDLPRTVAQGGVYEES